MKTYIHYGSSEYKPDLIIAAPTNNPTKPEGLWASPVNAKWSWKNYCDSEEWWPHSFEESFKFRLKKSARILEVHKEEDVLPYVISGEGRKIFGWKTDITDSLNIDKLVEDYDAMELYLSDNYIGLHDTMFYTWDCDSIVVWNPKVIELVD